MKAIIFGATPSSKEKFEEIKNDQYEIVAFCDNDRNKCGKKLNGIDIIDPNQISELQWDEIIIVSLSAMDVIKDQLLNMGIPRSKINISYVVSEVRARECFLRDYAEVIYKHKIQGSVAEVGVFQGEFAKIINEVFPDRRLYLFDTFEGFDARDIRYEVANKYSDSAAKHLNGTSEALVLSKMKYPRQCIIKRGYFPESAGGVLTRNFVL